jgi:hypothetical protein
MLDSKFLLIAIVTIIVLHSFEKIVGLLVTKYINGAAKPLGDITSTAIIWVIGIILTVTAGKIYP